MFSFLISLTFFTVVFPSVYMVHSKTLNSIHICVSYMSVTF